jgi:benzoyl-CoA reductase subunit C
MSTLEELIALSTNKDNPAVNEWKTKGKKIVGFICTQVPEEILYAADILPVRLRAPDCADTTSADVYMSHLNCTFMRSCLQYMFEGKFNFLDGFIFTNSCDHTRRLYDISREALDYPYVHLFSLPHKAGGMEVTLWHKGEVARFKESVEAAFGAKVT